MTARRPGRLITGEDIKAKKLALPAPRKLFSDDCPAKYTGPIEGADGKRPFNGYLWNDEWWWANLEISPRHNSRFNFGIVHLAAGVAAGGAFAVSGHLWSIEQNSRRYSFDPKPYLPRPNNFPTREAAIRAAAADLLRLARSARKWGQSCGVGSLHDPAMFAEIVNWVRAVVVRETGKGIARVMVAAPQPKPRPPKTGMALLDLMVGA